MSKKKAFIFDMDGTVALNDGHRGHYEYSKVHLDQPNIPVIAVIKATAFYTGWTPIAVSGRPEHDGETDVMMLTKHWIYGFTGLEHFSIYMRPEFLLDEHGVNTDKRDFRADDIVKEELYWGKIEPFYNVQIVFDDRQRVVDMWRRIGLHCAQVAEGNF